MLFLPPGVGRSLRGHGDAFTFTGKDKALDWARSIMEAAFLCKVEGKLGGDAADLK